MMNIKAVNDERLTFVTGGDNGDAQKEMAGNYCMYKIGDSVEVYKFTDFHVWTNHAVIIDIFDSKSNIIPRAYLVRYDDNSTRWVSANEIESN